MKKWKENLWLIMAGAGGALVFGLLVLPPAADGMSCTGCSGPVRTTSGFGTGSTCEQALNAALADAIGNAAGSPTGCVPCAISQESAVCSDAIQWPSLTRSANSSIAYQCEICSGGGPPM